MGGGTPTGTVLGSLIGCDDDLEYLAAFADRAAVSGGAMLLSGAVSFAGLNQLLGPLLSQTRGLSAAYRRALAVAFGCA